MNYDYVAPGLRLALFLSLALAPSIAATQVPPHQPGTICFTPYFWCPARPAGQPGAACVCSTPHGPVQGQLG